MVFFPQIGQLGVFPLSARVVAIRSSHTSTLVVQKSQVNVALLMRQNFGFLEVISEMSSTDNIAISSTSPLFQTFLLCSRPIKFRFAHNTALWFVIHRIFHHRKSDSCFANWTSEIPIIKKFISNHFRFNAHVHISLNRFSHSPDFAVM